MRGTIEPRTVPGGVEFPRVDPRVVGQRYRSLFHAARVAPAKGQLGFDGMRRTDLQSGQSDTWRYGDDIVVEEHVLVPGPRSATEGAGWLVGTSLDVRQGRTTLSVFDALRLADDPIAVTNSRTAASIGSAFCMIRSGL